jgi:hypothetical protein
MNRKNGSFRETATVAGVGYDEDGQTFAGMGVDAADYDNDGRVDLLITVLSNQRYPLFRNSGEVNFDYATHTSGIGRITLLYTGWGTRFLDADRDGWNDIFVAQGHVLDTIEKTSAQVRYRQPPLLARNTGKEFLDVSAAAGFALPLAARGAAFGDIDSDGDTDIVVGVVGGSPVIFRNNGTKNHWLGLRLRGSVSNRDALGARITITRADGSKRIFDVTRAGSYLSSNDPRVLVGLGSGSVRPRVEIRWPSGKTQRLENLEIDRYHTIEE